MMLGGDHRVQAFEELKKDRERSNFTCRKIVKHLAQAYNGPA